MTYLNQFHTPRQSHHNHARVGQAKRCACSNAHRGACDYGYLIAPVEIWHVAQRTQQRTDRTAVGAGSN